MPTRFIQANTNGRLHSADEPVLSPLDRGFLYGDAVYEVWRTYHGVVFAFDEHWVRLEASAAALHLNLPLSAAEARSEIGRTVTAYREKHDDAELYTRLQISRGGGDIGLDPALADTATSVLLVQALPALPAEKLLSGVRVATARDLRRNHPRTLNPQWKSGNYLNNLLALREARAAGADEVLMLNLAGDIAEAATRSVAFVRGSTVMTPPLGTGILASITRRLLLNEVAPRARVPVQETVLRPEELSSMDEAFLLSTTKDITPIASIDNHAFTTGVSTMTWRLKQEFAAFAREHAEAHPECRVFVP